MLFAARDDPEVNCEKHAVLTKQANGQGYLHPAISSRVRQEAVCDGFYLRTFISLASTIMIQVQSAVKLEVTLFRVVEELSDY